MREGVLLGEGGGHLVWCTYFVFVLHTALLLCGALVNGERERAGPHWRVLAGYSLTELRLYKKLKEETDGEEGRGGD